MTALQRFWGNFGMDSKLMIESNLLQPKNIREK